MGRCGWLPLLAGVVAGDREPGAVGGEPVLPIAVEQPGDAAVGLVVRADRAQAAERVVAPAVGVAAQLVQRVDVDIALGLARRVLADHDGHAIGDR
jgi:hypothetical protein